MKTILKRNYKLILGVIIGTVISVIAVYAETLLSSSNIAYNNSSSGLKSTDMNGAINELYDKVKHKPCKVLKGTGKNTNDEIICGTEEFYVLYSSGDSINVLTKYPIEAGAATILYCNYSGVIEGSSTFVGSCNVNTYYVGTAIANPSYAQNKNCGKENFKCGGTGFSSQYKKVLNRIGLSDSIEVLTLPYLI